MGLLDDFGLSGLIQDATKIVKEVQTIKDEVVESKSKDKEVDTTIKALPAHA